MSLNAEQVTRTAHELEQNLELSGLSRDEVASRLGWSADRLDRALAVHGAPHDVWALRDELESAVREAGAEGVRFTVLTEQAREAARGWFGIA